MSAHEHKRSAPEGPASCLVFVVSSTRTVDDDVSGKRIAELLEEAGHSVSGRRVLPDNAKAIASAVQAAARDSLTDLVVLTGGTGISARDVTPEAIRPLLDREIPGFGEIFRALSYQEIGSAAMLSRATAGLMGPLVVVALPGSLSAVELAMTTLVLPELDHLRAEVSKEAPVDAEPAEETATSDESADEEADEEEAPPVPSGSLGKLGQDQLLVSGQQVIDPAAPVPGDEEEEEAEEVPSSGWKRALFEIEGQLLHGKSPDLPYELEDHAPVMDVLHTAGEYKVVKLPSGVKYTLYGFPDLQRPGSKVLAIGWGMPYAEVLALHRYPVQTGLCIDEDRGLLPKRDADIERICEQITGRAPRDTSGKLFALQGDTVWIQRGNRVVKWDGSREVDDGTPKQVIATLTLLWSSR